MKKLLLIFSSLLLVLNYSSMDLFASSSTNTVVYYYTDSYELTMSDTDISSCVDEYIIKYFDSNQWESLFASPSVADFLNYQTNEMLGSTSITYATNYSMHVILEFANYNVDANNLMHWSSTLENDNYIDTILISTVEDMSGLFTSGGKIRYEQNEVIKDFAEYIYSDIVNNLQGDYSTLDDKTILIDSKFVAYDLTSVTWADANDLCKLVYQNSTLFRYLFDDYIGSNIDTIADTLITSHNMTILFLLTDDFIMGYDKDCYHNSSISYFNSYNANYGSYISSSTQEDNDDKKVIDFAIVYGPSLDPLAYYALCDMQSDNCNEEGDELPIVYYYGDPNYSDDGLIIRDQGYYYNDEVLSKKKEYEDAFKDFVESI